MAILRGAPDDFPKDFYNKVSKISDSVNTTWKGAAAFTKPAKEVKISVATHGAIFKFSADGVNWSDEIVIPDRCTVILPIDAHSFNIKCGVASGWCLYIVEGFYPE